MKLTNQIILVAAVTTSSLANAGMFGGPSTVDNKTRVDMYEHTHQAEFVRRAVPGRKYNVTGTSLYIIPQETADGALVTIVSSTKERHALVYDADPHRSKKTVDRYVNCDNYQVRKSLDDDEYVDVQPNTYSGALSYAICHLPVSGTQ